MITVIVGPLRTGEPGALLKQVTLADGRKFGNGGPAGRQTSSNSGKGMAMQKPFASHRLATCGIACTGCDAATSIAMISPAPGIATAIAGFTARSHCVPKPEDIPTPPLKPEFKAAYEAERKRRADADKRGEPIATGYTHCLPDGMPSMMMAMFPMEVLQTKGQVDHHPGSLQPGTPHLRQRHAAGHRGCGARVLGSTRRDAGTATRSWSTPWASRIQCRFAACRTRPTCASMKR